MDWNCVEGNWKQVKGQVKEKWGNLTEMTLTLLMADEISSKARFKNATALLRIRCAKTLTNWYGSQRW